MKKDIVLVVMAAVFLLSLIAILNPPEIISGQEAYYHLFAVQHEGTRLTTEGGPIIYSQYDYLLQAAFSFFDPVIFMKIFPIILGGLSVLLFYFIIKRFVSEESAIYSSLVFILSPTFLFLFSTNSAEMIPFFLASLGIFMLINKNQYISYISIIPFIFAAINSIFITILIFGVYLTYYIIKREKRPDFIIGAIILAGIIILQQPRFMIHYVLNNLNLAANLFSDFGGPWGISIFTAIFAFAGLIVTKKREYFYPIIILLIVCFFIDFKTLIYSNIIICGFAGIGLKRIIDKKWKLKNLKHTMNFLLICGLLFSTISHIGIINNLGPSEEMVEAAEWIEENSEEDSVIFTSISNSYFIEQISQRKVMLDPLSAYSENFKELLNDSNTIYYSRSLAETEKRLNKYNISYILIDQDMTDGDVWTRPKEGLLFLFTNQQKFPTAYNKGGIKIIYYIK